MKCSSGKGYQMKASDARSKLVIHSILRPKRSIIALVLTGIYLLISLSPLASLALNSKTVAHILTGECTENCITCGCSEESRISRSCCCIKKQQQLQAFARGTGQKGDPDCCNKGSVSKKIVTISCGSPCKKGKLILLSAANASELLPCRTSGVVSIPPADMICSGSTPLLESRYNDPPDPPPKLSIIS